MDLGLGEHRSWPAVERSSSAKYPEGGEEVVEKGAHSDGHGVQDCCFDRAIGFKKKEEKIEEEKLKDQCKAGGKIVVTGQSPRGGPRVKRPSGVEEIVYSATDDPSQESVGSGDAVTTGIKVKQSVPEG